MRSFSPVWRLLSATSSTNNQFNLHQLARSNAVRRPYALRRPCPDTDETCIIPRTKLSRSIDYSIVNADHFSGRVDQSVSCVRVCVGR